MCALAIGLVATVGALAPARVSAGEPQIDFTLPPGFSASLYATGLGRARLMAMTPAGDIVLSSPPRRVLLVKADRDGDGRSDDTVVLLEGLRRPHGLSLDPGRLIVATEDQVLAYPFDADAGRITGDPAVLLDGMPRDGGHSTRTVRRGPDGALYVSIGSSCNVCTERNPWRAAILRLSRDGEPEIFATGLRNTVGFDWEPATGTMYGVDNGRDWLGDDFPPDELNRIERGSFYGWPYFNGDNVPDPDYGRLAEAGRVTPVAPVHGFGAHVAPLSVHFLKLQTAPALQGAALVAEHGSWNRSKRAGYRLVAVTIDPDGEVAEQPFMSGFLDAGQVRGRPVDTLEAPSGDIFVTDDLNGAIWRITYQPPG
ncbi:MAG: PQQ-dependent sugar dehydrogenase [Hyphomicrobiaceae bacterium]